MGITLHSYAESMRQQILGGTPDDPPILLNHPTQSVTAIDGWKSFLCGLPFLAAGVFIIGADWTRMESRKHGPNWLIGLVGSFFLLAGAFLVIHGLRGLARRASYDRALAAQPDQPWLADYHWRRDGISFSAWNAMLSRLFAAVVWYAFLIPFFWVGLSNHGLNHVFLFGAVLFALIGIYFWIHWAKMLSDLLLYGNSFLAFDSFPYFLGGSFEARLRAPRHFDSIEKLTVTIRCVQEKYVTRGTGSDCTTEVVCYELYKDAASFTNQQLTGASSSYLPISFRLPENQLVTRLSDAPPTYWELEACGKASGVDYQAYFLLPVYRAS
jgi:hypothetical protein